MNQFEDDLFTEEIPKQELKRPCVKCKKNSPYQCPKCKVFYCSLSCYQTHNLNCTETFYKENIMEHLKGKKVSKEEAQKMKKIIDKIKEGGDGPEFMPEEKEKRYEEILEILESGEMTLDKLTIDELREFEDFIQDKDNLQSIIKEWVPWWKREEFAYNLDIKELDQEAPHLEDEKEEKLWAYRFDLRERYEKLPELEKLTKIQPSPELIHHICQFIFASAYSCREYNGDMKNCHVEVIHALNTIAPCLAEKVSLPSLQVAINTAIQNARRLDGPTATQFIQIVLSDLVDIFSNKFYLFELIFKYYDVLHHAHENYNNLIIKNLGGDNTKIQAEKKKVSALKQKLLFYLSYLKQKPQKVFTEIADQIRKLDKEFKKDQALNREMEKIVKSFDQKVMIYN